MFLFLPLFRGLVGIFFFVLHWEPVPAWAVIPDDSVEFRIPPGGKTLLEWFDFSNRNVALLSL